MGGNDGVDVLDKHNCDTPKRCIPCLSEDMTCNINN